MSKPPVIGRQLDRCDVCGAKTHKIHLVRTNVDFLSPTGNNYFDYSSYNSTFWDVGHDSVDAGEISIGPYADRARVVIGDDNTRTESFGTQTWTVGSAAGPYSGFFYMTSGAVDMSSWSSFVLSFDFGFYERDTSDKRIMVYSYIIDSGSNASGVIRRMTGYLSSGRYWWHSPTADINSSVDLSDAMFRILIGTYTGGEKIWIDRLQLEKNASKMGTFIPTTGSSVDQTDSRSMIMRKVCKSCYEPLLSRTEQYNREAEECTDAPIDVWMQEV